MHLDAITLITVALLANGVVAAANVLVWMQDRRETGPLWMAVATVLCCSSATLREILPDTWVIVFANAMLSLGLSSVATACRCLGGRAPLASGLAVPALGWLAACAVPAFMADQGSRVAASSATCALVMAWAVAELACDRQEHVAARWGLISVLCIQGVAAAVRAVAAATAQASPGTGVARTAELPLATLWSVGFLLLAGVGVILFVKERAERRMGLALGQDPLTGIANRRRFDEGLIAEFAYAATSGRPLSLVMIDADAFKAFNDLHGHVGGDVALRSVAGVLSALIAGTDGLAARYGGEEFAVLLPGSDDVGALRFAEAVCRGVRDLAVAHPGSGHGRLTVSAGCASAVPGPGLRAADLLVCADRALYAAKHSGRDRVHWVPCPEPPAGD